MKFTMEVEMDNAAFDEPTALAEVLEDTANRLRGLNYESLVTLGKRSVIDSNGNTVGKWQIRGKR